MSKEMIISVNGREKKIAIWITERDRILHRTRRGEFRHRRQHLQGTRAACVAGNAVGIRRHRAGARRVPLRFGLLRRRRRDRTHRDGEIARKSRPKKRNAKPTNRSTVPASSAKNRWKRSRRLPSRWPKQVTTAETEAPAMKTVSRSGPQSAEAEAEAAEGIGTAPAR